MVQMVQNLFEEHRYMRQLLLLIPLLLLLHPGCWCICRSSRDFAINSSCGKREPTRMARKSRAYAARVHKPRSPMLAEHGQLPDRSAVALPINEKEIQVLSRFKKHPPCRSFYFACVSFVYTNLTACMWWDSGVNRAYKKRPYGQI